MYQEKALVSQHLGFGRDNEEGRYTTSKNPTHLQNTRTTPGIPTNQRSAVSPRRTSRRRTKNVSTRKRMSLLSGQYFDIPTHEHGYSHFESGAVPGKAVKRRLFHSAARWDDVGERVSLSKLVVSPIVGIQT